MFLEISQNSQEHTCVRVPFLIKEILLKKRLWHRCFPVNFAKFLTTPFLTEQLRWLLLEQISRIFNIFFRTSRSLMFIKMVFLKISQVSQENPCVGNIYFFTLTKETVNRKLALCRFMLLVTVVIWLAVTIWYMLCRLNNTLLTSNMYIFGGNVQKIKLSLKISLINVAKYTDDSGFETKIKLKF